ncbi:phage tail protein I [Zooshikella harenae]|uniref:Phage tail protein I n=1 Tax=Zooshikella harenae TaxID=2827238 RepID=A0ABS5ZL34_9GAMM|nr:phage tail protein I [Zooshikella harenae]MBU2713787.1 phage tail protein I [Zooshikella harenae]
MSETLLPANATVMERVQEQVVTRLNNVPVGIGSLWSPSESPIKLLPWLAWTLSVDEWDGNWSEDQKRQTVQKSFGVHVKKGTVGSVRRALAAAGYGDAVIIEGLNAQQYNNTILYNGHYFHGDRGREWAAYRVYLQRPITITQAQQVRRLLSQTAPARCYLAGLHYDQALHIYNSIISYDGSFSHGVA